MWVGQNLMSKCIVFNIFLFISLILLRMDTVLIDPDIYAILTLTVLIIKKLGVKLFSSMSHEQGIVTIE